MAIAVLNLIKKHRFSTNIAIFGLFDKIFMLLFAQIRDSIQWVNGDSPNSIVVLDILIFSEGKVFERAPIGIIQMLVAHK